MKVVFLIVNGLVMLSAIVGVVLQFLNRAIFFVQLKLSFIKVKAIGFITVSVKV